MSENVWWEDSYVLSLMSPLSLFKRNSTLLPGTEVIVWGRLESPLVNILFRTKLLSLDPFSWDMDCLLTLWLTLPLVPLVMVAVRLVFWSLIIPERSFFYHSLYILRKIIKAPLLHQSLGPRVFFVSLSLSFSVSFSGWLSGMWRPVVLTFLPRLLRPPREGAWCLLRERSKFCVKGFIGPLSKPGNISLFLSFTLLLSTPYHQVLVY